GKGQHQQVPYSPPRRLNPSGLTKIERCPASRTACDYVCSLRTPLKGSPSFFWSMKRPLPLSRLVQVWLVGLNTCERSRTAPRRALSPTGSFFAISVSCVATR